MKMTPYGIARSGWLTACTALVFWWAEPVVSADTATVHLHDSRTTVFADGSVTYRMSLEDEADYQGRVGWHLTVAGSVVSRGENAVAMRHGAPVEQDITLEIPPLREGVEMEGRLSIVLMDEQGRKRAELSHPLYIYGRDPFTHRRAWLKQLNLHLYDPEGATAAAFDALEIPYRPAGNPASFADLGTAVLVIGEGLSLREYRGLMGDVMAAVRRGLPVIFLAPVEGGFPVPGSGGDVTPVILSFRTRDFVNDLSKALDAFSWSPAAGNVRSAFQLGGHRGAAEILVDETVGWPWMEVRYHSGGVLLLCGMAVVQQWEDSPTPRFLMSRMFEYVTSNEEQEP